MFSPTFQRKPFARLAALSGPQPHAAAPTLAVTCPHELPSRWGAKVAEEPTASIPIKTGGRRFARAWVAVVLCAHNKNTEVKHGQESSDGGFGDDAQPRRSA